MVEGVGLFVKALLTLFILIFLLVFSSIFMGWCLFIPLMEPLVSEKGYLREHVDHGCLGASFCSNIQEV